MRFHGLYGLCQLLVNLCFEVPQPTPDLLKIYIQQWRLRIRRVAGHEILLEPWAYDDINLLREVLGSSNMVPVPVTPDDCINVF